VTEDIEAGAVARGEVLALTQRSVRRRSTSCDAATRWPPGSASRRAGGTVASGAVCGTVASGAV
jgi:hypothetical protein